LLLGSLIALDATALLRHRHFLGIRWNTLYDGFIFTFSPSSSTSSKDVMVEEGLRGHTSDAEADLNK